jgi:beta-barrel assembly-enhancing protease
MPLKPLLLSAILLALVITGFQSARPVLAQPAASYLDLQNQQQLPTIGEPADRYLSPADEMRIGNEFLRAAYRAGAVLQDPEITGYVRHLGNTLANHLEIKPFDFTFFAVDENSINAFAVPGGYIGIHSGLILKTENENELAAVLAHEIAHVSQRHMARRIADMSNSQFLSLGALLAGILLAAGSGDSDAGNALIFSGIGLQQQQLINFTRSNEVEADRIGLGLLYKAGFDPVGMPSFFRTMQRNRFGTIPEEFKYLLTHPLDNVRITEAQSRIERLPKQIRPSSLDYLLMKSRVEALTAPDPRLLAEKVEKDLAQKKNKSNTDLYAHAQALERAGDYQEAKSILTRLAAADSENIYFQLALARVENQTGNQQQAIGILKRLHTLYPDNYPVVYHYAANLKEAKQAKEGLQLLRTYLLRNPALTVNAYKLLADLYESEGRIIDSKQNLAEYYFNSGNYSAAIYQLKQALNTPDVDFVTRAQIEKRMREIIQVTRS